MSEANFHLHRAVANAGPLSRKIERMRAERIEAGLVEPDPPPPVIEDLPEPEPEQVDFGAGFPNSTIGRVQRVVAEFYGVPAERFFKVARVHRFSWPRHVAMVACRLMTDRSLSQLARGFRVHDGSSIINAVKVVREKTEANLALDHEFREVCHLVRLELAKGRE